MSGKRNILRDLGETLNSAKALGQGEVLDVLEEPLGVAEVALDPEADHPAKSRLLPLGKLVLRVGRETRVDDLGAEGRGLEEVGHDKGVLLVLLHPDVEGLETTVGEKAIKRAGNSANGLRKGERERERGLLEDGDVCGVGWREYHSGGT